MFQNNNNYNNNTKMSEKKTKSKKISYKNLLNQIKNNESIKNKPVKTTDDKIIEIFFDETELRQKGLGGGNFNKIDKI